MLDDQTKARINSARDILVGKVPDPKSQVEQITIALIYKFMDDMDRQSEELGGKASFFSDGFKKYAWHKLIDPRLSGHERLMIYAEGLEKMNENKHIPQLFRDIFKGVFLPYRDPETLNLFLKQINEFSYDHSEQLGDAFEYLLSVLGSQGDAGQFRTPRHIIDFIVRIVDPKKNDTVLDPACGTAGFLISAYKHILAANSKEGKGDLLTGDERGRLMDNFCGYDIAPDMVRLSRANMYLHGFSQPRIHEYDTLTSEERWDERYDVIMANPPFMTPKGGIRPHNRFSIRAKRSEVLFVDYIAEHLNVNGRAGVIVPEGIISRGQSVYNVLRRMLVENYLWCVVSLPAGVFNPYSSVKTGILFMDKLVAKRTNEILFVNIESDGFDLGAQRRPIGTNDLPESLKAILQWKKGGEIANAVLSHAVSRKRVIDSEDCNLSGERYKDNPIQVGGDWPMVRLGSVCQNSKDAVDPKSQSGNVLYVGLENIEAHTGRLGPTPVSNYRSIKSQKFRFRASDVLYGKLRPKLNKVWLADRDGICSTDIMVLRFDESRALPEFVAYLLRQQSFNSKVLQGISGAQLPRVSFSHLANLEIPLPSPDAQQRIVEELDAYQKIVEGARQVVANYKPRIKIDPDWPMVELGNAVRFIDYRGRTPTKTSSGVPLITARNVKMGYINREPREFIANADYKNWMTRGIPKKGDVLFTTEAPLGNVAQIDTDERIALAQRIIDFQPNDRLNATFLKLVLMDDSFQGRARSQATGSTAAGIKASYLKQIKIPRPSLKTQNRIVEQIEEEARLIEANKRLVENFERRLQVKLAEIWGEEGK